MTGKNKLYLFIYYLFFIIENTIVILTDLFLVKEQFEIEIKIYLSFNEKEKKNSICLFLPFILMITNIKNEKKRFRRNKNSFIINLLDRNKYKHNIYLHLSK